MRVALSIACDDLDDLCFVVGSQITVRRSAVWGEKGVSSSQQKAQENEDAQIAARTQSGIS
jgi:hypothetical protein